MSIGTVFAFIVALIIQVAYPLAVTLYFRRRTRAPWRVFGYGALIFAVFQLATWLPLSTYLDAVIGDHLTSEWGAFLWLLALALCTSLVEEFGRWTGYRFLFPRGNYKNTWRNGVMYALGHSSVETTLFIAGLTFVYFLAYAVLSGVDHDLLFSALGTTGTETLRSALQSVISTSWEQPLIVAVERIMALPHQIAWSLLVMAGRFSHQKRWYLIAVLYHWSIAVIVPGLARLWGFGAAEAANLVLAGVSIWIISKLRALPTEAQG